MGDPINQVPGHPIPSGWIGMPALPADHSGKSLPSSSHRHPNQHCPRFQVFGSTMATTTTSLSLFKNSMNRKGQSEWHGS
jgi:hypothetical protein